MTPPNYTPTVLSTDLLQVKRVISSGVAKDFVAPARTLPVPGETPTGAAVRTATNAAAAQAAIGATATGSTLITASTPAAARAAIGATATGSTLITASTPAAAQASIGATATGSALITAATPAAAARSLGTSSAGLFKGIKDSLATGLSTSLFIVSDSTGATDASAASPVIANWPYRFAAAIAALAPNFNIVYRDIGVASNGTTWGKPVQLYTAPGGASAVRFVGAATPIAASPTYPATGAHGAVNPWSVQWKVNYPVAPASADNFWHLTRSTNAGAFDWYAYTQWGYLNVVFQGCWQARSTALPTITANTDYWFGFVYTPDTAGTGGNGKVDFYYSTVAQPGTVSGSNANWTSLGSSTYPGVSGTASFLGTNNYQWTLGYGAYHPKDIIFKNFEVNDSVGAPVIFNDVGSLEQSQLSPSQIDSTGAYAFTGAPTLTIFNCSHPGYSLQSFTATASLWFANKKCPLVLLGCLLNSASEGATLFSEYTTALGIIDDTMIRAKFAFFSQSPRELWNAAPGLNWTQLTTSTSSNVLEPGAKTFTVGAGLTLPASTPVILWNSASNYAFCTVQSYSGTTLVLNVQSAVGSGTYTSWTVGHACGRDLVARTSRQIADSMMYFRSLGWPVIDTAGAILRTAAPWTVDGTHLQSTSQQAQADEVFAAWQAD